VPVNHASKTGHEVSAGWTETIEGPGGPVSGTPHPRVECTIYHGRSTSPRRVDEVRFGEGGGGGGGLNNRTKPDQSKRGDDAPRECLETRPLTSGEGHAAVDGERRRGKKDAGSVAIRNRCRLPGKTIVWGGRPPGR